MAYKIKNVMNSVLNREERKHRPQQCGKKDGTVYEMMTYLRL